MDPHHPTLLDRLDERVFNALYRRSLVYNACWEDPAVDRRALVLSPGDTVLVITSAGCNVLDYALCGPKQVFAVDANPRQTALLELKLAGIRRLDYGDYFQVFGRGHHPHFHDIYRDALRADLSLFAREFWDKNSAWFAHHEERGSFYFHGLSGMVARAFRTYLRLRPKLAQAVRDIFEAGSVDAQRHIYDSRIRHLLWSRPMNWMLSRQLTLSMLGVPHPQRKEVIAQHADGVAAYIRQAVEYVFRNLPTANNYFWQVYLHGHYTQRSCPEYLQRKNFYQLKNGLVDRISAHTCTVTEFLSRNDVTISKYVLLDHMDWMSSYDPAGLSEEWTHILECATPNARAIFRSAHARPRFLRELHVNARDQRAPLSTWLQFHDDWAKELTKQDRVHTYAGFHIADFTVDA